MSASESQNESESESRNFRLEIRRAWAAGFLDGEGCIHIAKQRYRTARCATYRLGVHVTPNDRLVLERFRQAVGIDAPIYRVKRAKNHSRQCYTLNFSGRKALALLNLLLEFLERKRKEAQAGLDFWVNGRMGVRFGARGLDPDLVAVREHYFHLLKKLK